MPSTAGLPLYTPTALIFTAKTSSSSSSSTTTSKSSLGFSKSSNPARTRSRRRRSHGKHYSNMSCRASSSGTSSSSSSMIEFDLYDLLGIESSSDYSQIKTAYRSLQKRCHPDIAGPAGHDMAIILNEAYAVLSDPSSRIAYDKEQAKIAGLRGYTGKPIYSVWMGSESEERAVFVDEVKCVGCLKCALFAGNTFAIESVYGRARVVAQWADPEHKINEAIEACPVDCISVVERSNLAALEFLMSKQPRGNVRVGVGNAAGARVSNIFTDVKKFQIRFQDAVKKNSTQNSSETDLQRASRLSAFQAIRSISNWLYWKAPKVDGSTTAVTVQNLKQITGKCYDPSVEKLRDAAASRKQARESSKPIHRTQSKNLMPHEDYWVPSTHFLPPSSTHENSNSSTTMSEPSPTKTWKRNHDDELQTLRENNEKNPIGNWIPMGMAMAAAFIVHLQIQGAEGGVKEHMGGSLALQIVNSSWIPVVLAGITWCVIGMMSVRLAEAITNRED
ncbi:chaperone protein dnaJ C76, chloroplastic [Ziziphus jujuba]|uniref:Chaperone protein dnaJ C76, chloroplastic n=1 Tax=Ziziphus jujuba TaxID=326968 RepID=A0A6P4AEJ0_ZIZJJ|nr:chaperone protein dnaJ C76, chloroplastic [Ziziphus jujuba]